MRRTVIVFWLCIVSSLWGDLPSDTVFLTWQKAPDTTMTIQWLSPTLDHNELEFRLGDQTPWQKTIGIRFPLKKSSYFLHRIELINLKPNTVYQFRLSDKERIYKFRTMPQKLEGTIRFVVGGDMYHEDDATKGMRNTCRMAAKANPHFALIGGDIAYAVHGIRSTEKIERWVDWVKAWSQCMITSEGFLIPVLAAIGNHDIEGQYGQTPEKAGIFSSLFPMPGKQIYNVLDFGDYLSLFILDSGHANPIGGAQAKWLKKGLQERQQVMYRFAGYHVPAYPSVRSFYNENSSAIRKYWVPEFEKGKICCAFEHHDHAYKRTYPLLENKRNEGGIVYIGDGAWSVDKPRESTSRKNRTFLAKFVSTRYFTLVMLDANKCLINAIDDTGKMIDSWEKAVKQQEVKITADQDK